MTKLVNGACVDCGAVVDAAGRGLHQAFHDKARIEAQSEHQKAIADTPRAEDLRTPLSPEDIAARAHPAKA